MANARRILLAYHTHEHLLQIMLLDQGRLAEFDRPSVLLANPNSKFYALCKSTGKTEFAVLQRMANEAAEKAYASPQA